LPCEGVDVQWQARQRLQLLRNLDEQVKTLGLDLDLGGAVPS